jgi:hypothetical protein
MLPAYCAYAAIASSRPWAHRCLLAIVSSFGSARKPEGWSRRAVNQVTDDSTKPVG